MRTTRAVVTISFAVMLAFLGFAFVAFWPPHDFELVSVQIVGGKQPRLVKDIGPRSGDFAIINFSTKTDLAKLADNGLYDGLFVNVYFCRRNGTDDGPINGFSLVYDERGSIGTYARAGQITAPLALEDAAKPIPYHLYMDMADAANFPADDICFVVVPKFPFVGLWPPSNEVRVSRGVLAAAIDRYYDGATVPPRKKVSPP